MQKRPHVNESEEELLRQQEEFFKAQGKELPSSSTRIGTDAQEPSPNIEAKAIIIGEIIEKSSKVTLTSNTACIDTYQGFPSTFNVPSDARALKGAKRKSLFAQHLEQKKRVQDRTVLTDHPPTLVEKMETLQINDEIHLENVKKISGMSHDEIMESKKSLEASLSPELLNLLKSRGQKRGNVAKQDEPAAQKTGNSSTHRIDVNIEDVQSGLDLTVDKKWLEMDVIEPEKLQVHGTILFNHLYGLKSTILITICTTINKTTKAVA